MRMSKWANFAEFFAEFNFADEQFSDRNFSHFDPHFAPILTLISHLFSQRKKKKIKFRGI